MSPFIFVRFTKTDECLSRWTLTQLALDCLPRSQIDAARRHLSSCGLCQKELSEHQRVQRASLKEPLPERLLRPYFGNAPYLQKQKPGRAVWQPYAGRLAVACASLAAVVLVVQLQRGRQPGGRNGSPAHEQTVSSLHTGRLKGGLDIRGQLYIHGKPVSQWMALNSLEGWDVGTSLRLEVTTRAHQQIILQGDSGSGWETLFIGALSGTDTLPVSLERTASKRTALRMAVCDDDVALQSLDTHAPLWTSSEKCEVRVWSFDFP